MNAYDTHVSTEESVIENRRQKKCDEPMFRYPRDVTAPGPWQNPKIVPAKQTTTAKSTTEETDEDQGD